MRPTPAQWALGYFSLDGVAFTGLVVGERVRDLSRDRIALSPSLSESPGPDPTGPDATGQESPGPDPTGPDSSGPDLSGLDSPAGTRILLEHWDAAFPALSSLAAESGGTWHDPSTLITHAPLAPGQILQAGANYRTHVIDLAVAHADLTNGTTEEDVRATTAAMMDKRKAEGIPYIFIGLTSALTGPNDTVTLPGYSVQHDWELELAAVIGTPGFQLTPDQALGHVAAYVMVNDLTTRDLVFRQDMASIGSDWFRSKNAPGFLPLGPWLVPSQFVGDPQALHLELTLNGDVMQDATAADMIFSVAQLVSAASQTVRLSAGDLILTGSPAGNGAHWGRLLRHGDIMESTIDGLGVQRTPVVAETAR